MNFRERLDTTRDILVDCPYQIQKDNIRKLFQLEKKYTKSDILLRLFVIDSCYSTSMNKRLFGFEMLADLILDINHKLNKNINIDKFIDTNFELLKRKPIGISKMGFPRGHALSLFTKYIYFKTKFHFPIYDNIVFDALKEEGLIKSSQKYSKKYFKVLIMIKNKCKISFDALDKYFWVCGKIRKGNLSLLISDSNIYKKEFLDRLDLKKGDYELKSKQFDQMLSEKLYSKKDFFKNAKLKKIQKLARSIKNEPNVLSRELNVVPPGDST